MGERLLLIKLQPARVLDWGAFVGAGHAELVKAYPHAAITAVEADEERRVATAAGRRPAWWKALAGLSAMPVLRPHEVGDSRADLLWANMVLHGVVDPQREFNTWHRALAVDGFLMFSTLGPGSLQELVALYGCQGWPAPFAPFVDMHDLGDMLVHAGFADPVMDQEMLTLTWPSADALLAELRLLGGNVDSQRAAGLRTPRWRRQLVEALHTLARRDGRLALTFEVIYGHAFKPRPRPKLAGETAVSLDDMRAMVRRGGSAV